MQPCWLAPCWRLHSGVVQRREKSQNCGAAIDATTALSSTVAHLQVPDLLRGTMNTKLQMHNLVCTHHGVLYNSRVIVYFVKYYCQQKCKANIKNVTRKGFHHESRHKLLICYYSVP